MSSYIENKFTVATCPECKKTIGQVLRGMTCFCRDCMRWFETEPYEMEWKEEA